jgi:AraC-like DNA-binding protein
MLFFVLYGITTAVPFFAAVYLLLRRANAIAPSVTSPVRLRRWTAAFFAVATLVHVWWLLFYIFSCEVYSVSYMVIVTLDTLLLFTTFAGTLLAMLQDRRRPLWPWLAALIPFVVISALFMVYPGELIEQIVSIYLTLLTLLFTAYMVLAIRQYGRWLNDNYADLENKKVWLCQTVSLVCMLLFVVYILATDMVFIWLIHIIELVLVGLLMWRVETLPNLETRPQPLHVKERLRVGDGMSGMGSDYTQGGTEAEKLSPPLPHRVGQGESFEGQGGGSLDLVQIERLLNEHCVATQLYLQHDLSRDQLAQAVGTNRSYLSQYFSRQGITYNTYINNLRINYFISRYEECVAAGHPVTAKQLAHESGFGSYRTFSRAFAERTGQSVTDWMRDTGDAQP